MNRFQLNFFLAWSKIVEFYWCDDLNRIMSRTKCRKSFPGKKKVWREQEMLNHMKQNIIKISEVAAIFVFSLFGWDREQCAHTAQVVQLNDGEIVQIENRCKLKLSIKWIYLYNDSFNFTNISILSIPSDLLDSPFCANETKKKIIEEN